MSLIIRLWLAHRIMDLVAFAQLLAATISPHQALEQHLDQTGA